ncbi:Enoyl-CoA hydratase [Rhodovastum atsumiense]|uniref:Enoyl-CoA hydratase n=1 Tax=Rhodovastum atsumiense TaxID=504468 RepID=A0A5M6IR35_9PROT|nr:enoyl-CoA hydratase-related protein [Rhodovastum atsumiense]KAA5609935.1 enoyl-CoA hydratase [Rhodovastum atsumiense]CAH2604554.1 Enoyl-CoA hydratase [Rhodovastum atsumiense]
MTPAIVTRMRERPEGRVARITLAQSGPLNVLGLGLMEDLAAALRDLAGDEALRAVVLAGEGARAFIGGADLAELAEADRAMAQDFAVRLQGVCQAIRTLPVPVIARLQGWTIGAGLELACACDLRIAASGALFAMPELRMGLPCVTGAALLPGLIGWGRTRRLLLTGEPIDAATALAWGLVEEVVEEAELERALERLVGEILAGAPGAVRRQKALMRQWEDLLPAERAAPGLAAFAACWDGPEPRQRLRAVLAGAQDAAARVRTSR